jgi:hypothetical protein
MLNVKVLDNPDAFAVNDGKLLSGLKITEISQ